MQHFDLDGAVRAGVIRSDHADALRRFDETQRNAPGATEEHFRLVSGFADVMAAMGLLMVTGTLIMTVGSAFPPACLLLPVGFWCAAKYFTIKRRLALSSFAIFGGYALTSAMAALAVGAMVMNFDPRTASHNDLPGVTFLLTSAVAAVACYAWWQRFELPLSFAAFAIASVNVGVNAFRVLFPQMPDVGVELLTAATGLILFSWAMWWDISDVRRETLRSDVAFWLHVAAGFLLVKSGMVLVLGRAADTQGWGRLFTQVSSPSTEQAAAVLLLFLLFGSIALVIDRRSLLISGMFYAVPAVGSLMGTRGNVFGPAFLIGGLVLVMLAVRWAMLREKLLPLLPREISAQLPRPQIKAVGPRPFQ